MALVRERITSEDYADIMIQYNGNESEMEVFAGQSYYFLNSITAVVHIPVSNVTNKVVLQFGYSAMPECYGTISEASLEASGIIRTRAFPNLNLRGQGVIIAIMDSGIDYTNPIFQNEDGTTRIIELWDQTIQSEEISDEVYYGTIYTREDINRALQSENPYDIVPSRDNVGHGTMVAGIAGGKERPESDFYGIATDAEFVIVKLKQAKKYLRDFFLIPEGAVCYQETDIISAIQYVRSVARRLTRPLAMCLAVGSAQGAHDGTGVLESFLSVISTTIGNINMIAAGNEGNARRHFAGEISSEVGYELVEINVGQEEGFSMELWGNPPSVYSIDIQSPSGEYIPRIVATLDESREITFIFEETVINIDYQMIESLSGAQLILMRFKKPTQGIWRIRVYGTGTLRKTFNVWLPMQDFISPDTYFIRSSPYVTILSAGNSTFAITITAYNDDNDSLLIDSSRGFTRIHNVKPDLAAPGVNVIGPTLSQSFVPYTGTSVAVAQGIGIAALLLQWGFTMNRFPQMNSINAKRLLIRGARRNINLTYPNRDWGYGIIDLFGSFEAIITDVIGL